MMIDLKAKPFFLNDQEIAWVKNTIAGMTLEEKVGQLFCANCKSPLDEELDYIFDTFKPGACMYRPLKLEDSITMAKKIRERSRIPMLIAANLEKGGNGIIQEGTLLGSPMEVAATDDVQMAVKLATVCAQEGKTVGANWAFAPIIDIDSNFRNPITNTRTFGSDPERVSRMGVAYVKEIQKLGLAASIKHFPGDGQDERDQHLVTSINDMDCETWMQTYGKVYKDCIEAGALTCMVGHIMQPAWTKKLNPEIQDEDILPGSLCKELMEGLLREKLGFNGLICTDATTMAGFTLPMSREKAVPISIANGADMFLFARNLKEDYEYMKAGVLNGIITPERLEEALTRILATKAALGLHKHQLPLDLEEAKKIVGCETHQIWAMECADKAITLVKEQSGVLPLTTEKYRRILFYPIEAEGGFSQYKVIPVCEKVKRGLEKEGFLVDTFVPDQVAEGKLRSAASFIEKYDLIVYVANLATKSNQTIVRIEWKQPMGADCAHFIHDIPTIFISLENPYHLLDIPRVKTYINTYSANDASIQQLIEKLMGRSTFKGISPVDPFCGKWDTRL